MINSTRLVKGRPNNRFPHHAAAPVDQPDPDTYRPDLSIQKLNHSGLPPDPHHILAPVKRPFSNELPATDVEISGRRRLALRHSFSTSPFSSFGRTTHDNSSSATVGTIPSADTRSPFDCTTFASESQVLDVGQAIALLEQLKKTATPEELVALHKALLPSKRVKPVAGSGNSGSKPSCRNRADIPPGIATRGGVTGNLLRKPGELTPARSKPDDILSDWTVGSLSKHSSNDITALDLAHETRCTTPSELSYTDTGVYRHGTLRIMNGAASPDPSRAACTKERHHRHARKVSDHIRPESPERRFTVEVMSSPADNSTGTTQHRVLKSEQARWQRRSSGQSGVPQSMALDGRVSPKSTTALHPYPVANAERPQLPLNAESYDSALSSAHELSLEYASECLNLDNPYDEEQPHSFSDFSSGQHSTEAFANEPSEQRQGETACGDEEKIAVHGTHRTSTQRSYDSGYGSDEVERQQQGGISGLQLSMRNPISISEEQEANARAKRASLDVLMDGSTTPSGGSSPATASPITEHQTRRASHNVAAKVIPSLPRIVLGKLPDLKDVPEKGLTSTLTAHLPRPVSLISPRSSIGGGLKPLKKLQKPVPPEIVAQRKYTQLQATRNISPAPSEISACSATPTAFLNNLLAEHAAPATPHAESPESSPHSAHAPPRASLARSPATFDATTAAAAPKKKLNFLRVQSKINMNAHSIPPSSSPSNFPGPTSENAKPALLSSSQQCQSYLSEDHCASLFEVKANSGMNEEAASKFARKKSRDLYSHDKSKAYDAPRTATPRRPEPTETSSARNISVEDRFPEWQSKPASPLSPPKIETPQRSFTWFAESIPPVPELPDVSILEARKVGMKGARKVHSAATSPTTSEHGTRLHGKSPLSGQALTPGDDEAKRASGEVTPDRSSRFYARHSEMRKFACSPLPGGSSPRPSLTPEATPEPDASKVWWLGKQSSDENVAELEASPEPMSVENRHGEPMHARAAKTQAFLGPANTARVSVRSHQDPATQQFARSQADDKENMPPQGRSELYASANSSESSINDGRLSNYENVAIGQAQSYVPDPKTDRDTLPSRRAPHRTHTEPSPAANDVLRRQIEHERAHALARLDANNQAKRLHRPQQRGSDIPFNRYSGGLGYGWDPAWGFSGSAGTRDERSPTRKIKADSKAYGLDLTDVPVFLRKVT